MRPVRFLAAVLFALPSLLRATAGDSLPGFYRAPVSLYTRSESKPHEVRNYIRPSISFDNFNTGSRPVKLRGGLSNPMHYLNNRLGKYQFGETNIGFYTPLWTHTSISGKDTTDVNTFHLLLTFNALGDRSEFSGLEKQHRLFKTGIGLRSIYAFGSQFIMFADVFPFTTGDHYDKKLTQSWRLGGSLIFNYMVNPALSFRAGVTKNFMWGNRYFLPVFGIRMGRLDSKFYVSIQAPRFISFNFQPSHKIGISLYSRVYGGLYDFSNRDSVYLGNDKVIQVGYTGIANGMRFDFRPNPNFSFFLSGGFAVRNHLWFYSRSFNPPGHIGPLGHFYDGQPDPTLFIHFGFTYRFGKAKRSAGNYLMYDVFDLNAGMDAGDNNSMPASQNPGYYKKEEMKKVQYQDVVDLVDESDLY